MSTGKRLAKRSIIGMRVCALGEDGLYYPGRIHAVKTPASPKDNQNCINLTPNTRYSVRFDQNPVLRRGIYEFSCSELIGDGFGSIIDVKLKPGQKVYVTHNGRETTGTVVEHDVQMDEVTIEIQASANEVSSNLIHFLKKFCTLCILKIKHPRHVKPPLEIWLCALASFCGSARREKKHSDRRREKALWLV